MSGLQLEKAFKGIGAEQMFPEQAANLQKDEPIAAYPLHERKIEQAND